VFDLPYGSNAKIRFQAFFMLTTILPRACRCARNPHDRVSGESSVMPVR